MAFKAKIYDRRTVEPALKQEENKNWGYLALAFLLMLLGSLLVDVFNPLAVAVILIGLFGFFYWQFKDIGKRKPMGKYIGELVLTPERFTMHQTIVETSEIIALRIEIGPPKGHVDWMLDGRGYRLESGTTSKIEVTTKSQVYEFNFLLNSDLELQGLRPILVHFYSRGLFVKEFYRGGRSYLLEQLDYEAIQEFKKKYNLTGSSY